MTMSQLGGGTVLFLARRYPQRYVNTNKDDCCVRQFGSIWMRAGASCHANENLMLDAIAGISGPKG
ncbi:Uncharacterized protein APZ42_003417 [Daphnia magna]|uniref:Uncharacterized protein n=1 Tax=Daphnia magna TaxID=35525 RepID=A0A162CWX0_9CRUS|nr:Uncharacterized protein APZ42_003417 [Daphnia magna]